MRVERISLTNFLSYKKASAFFDDGINVITGKNASGKTNLVDGLYFASVGKSSRALRDKEMINWDAQEGARVTLNIQKRFSKHEIDIYIDPQGKKRILVDGLPLQRIGELMGVLNVVLFSPGEMRLIKESPADRRRFLDISLSQQSKTYFYALQRYNNLLAQRNKLLKTYKGRPTLIDMLKIVDTDMIRCCVFIIAERDKFIKKLAPLAEAEHAKITGGKEELRLVYETEAVDFEDLSESLGALYKESFAADSRLEYTTIGAHRDDIKIASNGVDIRKFGSQGQQRSAVLSLKLAEIALFKDKTGEYPVLLLDDVLSELDESRRKALFAALEGIQTMVTCTEFEKGLASEYKEFLIENKSIIVKD